jgi:transcriptional regulator with PAS, ATPase and Fis domain
MESLDSTRPDPAQIERFHGFIARSEAMKQLFAKLVKAAESEFTVTIHGETGTGKELAARALHRLSSRGRNRLCSVNCANLEGDRLASKLFGHVEGAYTGAVRDREGLLRRADGGTIFLDEVAELPPGVQTKLLRVLEERQFRPLGSDETRRVDVRVVAASNRSMQGAVGEGTFRRDLYYRLRVVPLEIPPLRERKEDIFPLVWYYIDRLNDQTSRTIRSVEPEVMDAFHSYSWPGNVREIRNVVSYAFALGEGSVFSSDELHSDVLSGESSDERTEKQQIRDALAKTDGNRTKAAEKLGISRTTLWRKIKEYNLQLD